MRHATVLVCLLGAAGWCPADDAGKKAAADAAKIETAFAKRKGTMAEWERLLNFYNSQADAPGAAALRDKRVELIAALAARDDRPSDVWGPGAKAAIYREGDAFASPEGYERVKQLLAVRCAKWKHYAELIWFLYPEEPEAAIQLASRHGHAWDGGVAVAYYLLGVRKRQYGASRDQFGKIVEGSPATPLGQSLLGMVKQANSPLFLSVLADFLNGVGQRLGTAGTLNWDYTATANAAFARAVELEPNRPAGCGFPPVALPARDPPVAAASARPAAPEFKMLKAGKGEYPPEAVQRRVQGVAAYWLLVGCSGRVIALDWAGGPPELRHAGAKMIAANSYEPYSIGGQRIQVLTYQTVVFKLE